MNNDGNRCLGLYTVFEAVSSRPTRYSSSSSSSSSSRTRTVRKLGYQQAETPTVHMKFDRILRLSQVTSVYFNTRCQPTSPSCHRRNSTTSASRQVGN